jgi:hypothetical protein
VVVCLSIKHEVLSLNPRVVTPLKKRLLWKSTWWSNTVFKIVRAGSIVQALGLVPSTTKRKYVYFNQVGYIVSLIVKYLLCFIYDGNLMCL